MKAGRLHAFCQECDGLKGADVEDGNDRSTKLRQLLLFDRAQPPPRFSFLEEIVPKIAATVQI